MYPRATFRVIVGEHGVGIRCLDCGEVSWNKHDVLEQFCARCMEFHETKRLRWRYQLDALARHVEGAKNAEHR